MNTLGIQARLRKIEKTVMKNKAKKIAYEIAKNKNYRIGGKNDEFKQVLNMSALRQWQVAEAIGEKENTFSRLLRHEIEDTELKNRIYDAVLALMVGCEE